MKKFDIIILGAGASGCMCALQAPQNKKVALIDKNTKIGKKILVTGNGRCNITNKVIFKSNAFYNQNIDNFLSKFDNFATLKYFKALGLETYFDDEGRSYPLSNTAKSVTDIIENNLKKSNVDIFLEHEILEIKRCGNNFLIAANKDQFECQKLIVAMGGNTTTEFCKKENIKIKDFCPSLVALKTQSTKNLANTRLSNVLITAKHNGKTYQEKGEVLFKESGLSGIAIFNSSSIFARDNDFSGEIAIDLLPNLSQKEVIKLLSERKKLNEKISNLFVGMFANPVGYELLNRVKLDENRSICSLTESEIEKFANLIKSLTFSVKGCYDNNQVFAGGVCFDELTENFESKKIQNLYFCGEVCDVDGLCGGYNLQWAWTSGYIVAKAL